MIIVTGAAGFIGMHVAERLIARGQEVIGVDDFNAYYSVPLKRARAALLDATRHVKMHAFDVADAAAITDLCKSTTPTAVIHLAAQAGVRYSLEAPFAYEHANVRGHLAVLEAVRATDPTIPIIYASSSSVYGDRPLGPVGFSEKDPVDAPASLYAATKRSCELMSAAYAKLYGLRQTGLRFFTAYGPWGRPDMAYFSFTQKILAGQPIDVFGEGRMARDFTFIDDIVDGIVGVLDHPPAQGQHRIFNLGDSAPVALLDMIQALEGALGVVAEKRMRPMQLGDVTATFADISALHALCDYRPKVALQQGLDRFVAWYRANASGLGL